MVRNHYTTMGGSRRDFPLTQWSLIDAIRSPESKEREAALEQLLVLYWKPTYCWLRRSGFNDSDSKDLTQEFFLAGLRDKKFQKANPVRGRFRTFFLACLSNFIANHKRYGRAKGRQPTKPVITIDMMETGDIAVELIDSDTPEKIFNHMWLDQLLRRVLRSLEQECIETAKELHYKLFRLRVIEPIFEGSPQPPIKKLAKEMHLTEKQACNYVVTARLAYQRLLREEIHEYAVSDKEVAQEIADLFAFAGR
ncbi:hypothetical protein ACFL5F_01425 [Planctomycetota bacterium]